MENPNTYNDEDWARYSSELQSAISGFWESGASISEIEECISNGMSDVTDASWEVTIAEGAASRVDRVKKMKKPSKGTRG